jgi:ATPase components of ABC transporters with duplicated ATPase domains
MRIIKFTGLTHEYIGKSLYNDTELTVVDGRPNGTPDHIGLVGPNGSGKTTLVKIITGEVVPDAWQVETNGHIDIGVLDQFADIEPTQTVYSYLNAAFDKLYETERRMHALYDSIAALPEDEQLHAVERAGRMEEYLGENGFDRVPKKLDSVLSGLGFTDADREKSVTQLSGGMKTKLILGRLLLEPHDLMVLDEPTNFLDAGYVGWLAEWLRASERAFIVISHDVAFLNRVSNKIVEIANRKLKIYPGDYDNYMKEKARREELQLRQHNSQQKYIARAEEYIANNSEEAMGGIVRTKATWLKKMLTTLERIERPDEIVRPQFRFRHTGGVTAAMVLELRNVEVGYSGTPVLPALSLRVESGDKLIFKGFNGIGKTTLLKSIYGDLPLVSGKLEYGDGVESVFLRQEEDYENNFSHFDRAGRKLLGIRKKQQRAITVMEFAKEYYPEKPNRELQAALFACGLNEVHFFNPVRTLSGGEMTRLRLCLAMLHPVNLIILDEPTNHLDVYSKEVLMHSLDDFAGTVLMTTHDVNADVTWATRIVNLEELFG